jgi:hypothetical protein
MRERQRRAAARVCDEAGEIATQLRSIHARSGHGLYRIYDDWISTMALALSNGMDHRPAVWQRREDEYMQIVARHGGPTMEVFKALMHEQLVAALEHEPTDVLGSIYMALELGNDHAGQFFTPTAVCETMASLTLGPDDLRAVVERDGFIRMQEPAIGGGALVIPFIRTMLEAGLNPSEQLHVTGVDVDSSVLRMAYVQLSLLGVPGVFYVGNTLSMEMRDDWYTPVHIMLGWGQRLRTRTLWDELRAVVAMCDGALAEMAQTAADEPSDGKVDGDGPVQGELFK